MQNETYTVPELAEYWKISPFTVYRMLERKELPGFKIGRKWRISAATVVAYEEYHQYKVVT